MGPFERKPLGKKEERYNKQRVLLIDQIRFYARKSLISVPLMFSFIICLLLFRIQVVVAARETAQSKFRKYVGVGLRWNPFKNSLIF